MAGPPRSGGRAGTFAAQVLGPHFEQLCREYAFDAGSAQFGGLPAEVGAGTVTDPARRSQIEIDVVVLGPATPGEPRRLLGLGEAKWGERIPSRHIERLRRARDLLADRYDTRDTVLAGYSGAGFEPGLDSSGGTDRILTVDLTTLYGHTI